MPIRKFVDEYRNGSNTLRGQMTVIVLINKPCIMASSEFCVGADDVRDGTKTEMKL